MGDIAVDIFLETLKQIITSSNSDLIIAKKDQLQSFENEIKYLRGFLKITEKKRNEYSEVMKLAMQIRDVVSKAENIVELFVSHAFKADASPFQNNNKKKKKKQKKKEKKKKKKAIREHQDHLALVLESVKMKIKTLMAKVKEIYDKNMYDINGVVVKKPKHSSTESEGGSSSSRGKTTSKVIEEKTLVGFADEVETLMGKLHDSGEGGQLEIISIIGAGGGGKTTLAREVYNHPLTLHKFEIRAWANISQDYHKTMKRDLLISILESASPGKHEDCGDSGEDKLGEMVYKCLQGKKYLIVMDDIWDIEAWNDIQKSFPRKCKGSKVLFTGRLLVQPHSVAYVSHRLNPLPESCSWELLQKKVFGKKECPSELVDIGKQIAKKCEGLPLAIVAIAGTLATEDKTFDVWEKVAKHLSSIIAKNQEGYMEILELSYNHLPLHLKACFLYIGGRPKDSEIPVRELIWLWIAEGFIQQSDGGKSLEAIAEDYLIDLINRSLVMIARTSKSHGRIKACRIHDLLRELCWKKIEEDNFLVRNYSDDSFSPSATNKYHRLFNGTFLEDFPPRRHARNIRSLLCLSLPKFLHSRFQPDPPCYLSFFAENFELLRVLHLMPLISLGKIGIGDLVHLRYLALRLQKESFLYEPHCFPYLSNLETLNLQVSRGYKISLPRDIVKMVKLRHLYTKRGIFNYHQVFNYDEEEENMLDNLQTLHRLCPCKDCRRLLERTPNLRKLGLCGFNVLLVDLKFLKCLEILYVEEFKIDPFIMGGWHQPKFPPTLTRLTLETTDLKWERLSIILQTLPSLEVLKLLKDAFVGPIWNTSELDEGFSQLKYLKFEYLNIEEWSASGDEFPVLEVLVIERCKKLKRIPINFVNLNELREIDISCCCPSLEQSAKEIQEKQRDIKDDDDCVNTTFYFNTDDDDGRVNVVYDLRKWALGRGAR